MDPDGHRSTITGERLRTHLVHRSNSEKYHALAFADGRVTQHCLLSLNARMRHIVGEYIRYPGIRYGVCAVFTMPPGEAGVGTPCVRCTARPIVELRTKCPFRTQRSATGPVSRKNAKLADQCEWQPCLAS
jgi:hypothetical protein